MLFGVLFCDRFLLLMKRLIPLLAIAYLFNLPDVFANLARQGCSLTARQELQLRDQDRWLKEIPEIRLRMDDFLVFYIGELAREPWISSGEILKNYIASFPMKMVYRAISLDRVQLEDVKRDGFYSSLERMRTKKLPASLSGPELGFSEFLRDVEDQIIGNQSNVISVSMFEPVAVEIAKLYQKSGKDIYLFRLELSEFYLIRFSHLLKHISPEKNILNQEELHFNNLLITKDKIDDTELFIRRHIPADKITSYRKL